MTATFPAAGYASEGPSVDSIGQTMEAGEVDPQESQVPDLQDGEDTVKVRTLMTKIYPHHFEFRSTFIYSFQNVNSQFNHFPNIFSMAGYYPCSASP